MSAKASDRSSVLSNALDFIDFLNRNPTPFHVVESCRDMLLDAGFRELKLNEQWWYTEQGGKYFTTKNDSTLVAFKIGRAYKPGNGFAIVGAHTDSPCLKLKLNSKRQSEGYLLSGVETYGGGIWCSWFDRDLTVAGRCLIKRKGQSRIETRLVHIKKPILRVPHLAIHLQRDVNEKFAPNLETKLVPVLATRQDESTHKNDMQKTTVLKSTIDKHHALLLDLIKEELQLSDLSEIYDIELSLVDTQPAQLGGARDEFIFGARLDNQVGSYCAMQALLNCSDEQSDTCIRMAVLFDHEEVGSQSASGAASALVEHIMRRLSDAKAFELDIERSFIVSSDQAHAVHPNYAEFYEDNHKPSMNGGIVLKYNTNQKYATNMLSEAMVRECARLAQVQLQDYMVRNDSTCGSTIGPILSSKLGLTTVDIGAPQLAMHSCREMGSALSITQLIQLLTSFYTNYTTVRDMIG